MRHRVPNQRQATSRGVPRDVSCKRRCRSNTFAFVRRRLHPRSIELSLAYGAHGGSIIRKARGVLAQIRPLFRYSALPAVGVVLAASGVWFASRTIRAAGVIALLVLLGCYSVSVEQYTQHVPMIYGPVLMAPMLFRTPHRAAAVAAGMVTAFAIGIIVLTSADGLWNAALAAAPADDAFDLRR